MNAFLEWLKSRLHSAIQWVKNHWAATASPLLHILGDCIWSVLVLGTGALLMIFNDQGAEIAQRTGDDWRHAVFAMAGMFLWAIHTWFDARRILEHRYAGQKKENPWIAQTPRILGSAAVVVGLIAFLRAWLDREHTGIVDPSSQLVIASALLIFGFYRLVHARESWGDLQLKRQKESPGAWQSKLQFGNLDWLGRRLDPITLIYSTLFFLLATVAPVTYGFTFGSAGIVFTALSSIVWAGSWLTLKISDGDRRVPPIGPPSVKIAASLMVLLAIVWHRDGATMLAAVATLLAVAWKFSDRPWIKQAIAIARPVYSATLGLWRRLLSVLLTLKLIPRPKADAEIPDPTNRCHMPERSEFPVLPAMIVLAFAFSSSGLNDNHKIPVLDPVKKRPDIAQFSSAWHRASERLAKTDHGKKPLVIVATAGGGIRAGYWTAAVLSGITDAYPDFRTSLYAISGVSGGSVGTAVYASALQAAGKACEASAAPNCLREKVLNALKGEFLAPTVARMLYSDLAQRFLPVPLLPDRAGALEESWQARWRQVMGRELAGLDTPLSTLVGATEQGWQPALLLNSTHVEEGKRVVASNVALSSAAGRIQDAVDLISLLGDKDIRLGTAALNSARFTYVSPPGTLPCPTNWPLCSNGHVVDGGYFENFGAVTALQVLQAAEDQLKESVQPIVILISNDVKLVHDGQGKFRDVIASQNPPRALENAWFGMESLGPVEALLSVREARGILAAKALWNHVDEQYRFHFAMDIGKEDKTPALGWVLSEPSETMMQNLLLCSDYNRTQFKELLRVMGATSQAGKVPEQKPSECSPR